MSINFPKGLNKRFVGSPQNDRVGPRAGFVAGGEGKPVIVFPAPDTVAIFDDFLGDLVADEWIAAVTDTGQTTAVFGTSAVSATKGVVRLKSSATAPQTPVTGPPSLNTPP